MRRQFIANGQIGQLNLKMTFRVFRGQSSKYTEYTATLMFANSLWSLWLNLSEVLEKA